MPSFMNGVRNLQYICLLYHFLQEIQHLGEKLYIFLKNPIDKSKKYDILIFVTREWRNWQTRTFEGRVVRIVRVQFPSPAPYRVFITKVMNTRYFLPIFSYLEQDFCSFSFAMPWWADS